MSSLNNLVFATDLASSADVTSCTDTLTAGMPITLSGASTIGDIGTWTAGNVQNICFNYDSRGWPWICGKCHKIAFSTNQILNKFCSHDGWMVKLKAGMKI